MELNRSMDDLAPSQSPRATARAQAVPASLAIDLRRHGALVARLRWGASGRMLARLPLRREAASRHATALHKLGSFGQLFRIRYDISFYAARQTG
jgi:hypothetical protein